MVTATLLAAPMLFFVWYSYGKGRGIHPIGLLFGILFICYTIVLIVKLFMKASRITNHFIFVSLSTYLLSGILWSLIYGIFQRMEPASFSVGGMGPYTLLYFSFLSLTTLGCGDIAPITQEARALAVLEAIIGQLYLAVIVASLVGIYISNKFDKNK